MKRFLVGLCCVCMLMLASCGQKNVIGEEYVGQFVCDMVAMESRANADVLLEQYKPHLNDTVYSQLESIVTGNWKQFNEVFEGNPPGATCKVTQILKDSSNDVDRYLVEAEFVSDTYKERVVLVAAQVTVSDDLISDWRYECYDTNPTAFDPWA